DPDILQRKSRKGTFREHLSYALLHRGDELPRNRASHHVIHELEARAALQRLDAQEHFAELTGAAGLLLMPAVTFRGAGNRLPVGNAGRVRLHVHTVALT